MAAARADPFNRILIPVYRGGQSKPWNIGRGNAVYRADIGERAFMLGGNGIYGATVIFGVRVVFIADNREALSATLARYNSNEMPAAGSDACVYVVLATDDTNEHESEAFRVHDTTLYIVADGICSEADGARGHGRCSFALESFDSAAVADAINTVVLFLVGHSGRIPVHASALMLGDTAMVLAGKSGSGKSTLALAANRAGLPIMTDDTVFIQTAPRFRVWAFARAIHVFEKDFPPGVQGDMRFRSGRWKKAMPISQPRCVADRAMLCLLQPGGKASIAPMLPEDAVRILTSTLEPGYQFYGDHTNAAIRAIAADGCWRLTLSNNPDDAISLLRNLDRAREAVA